MIYFGETKVGRLAVIRVYCALWETHIIPQCVIFCIMKLIICFINIIFVTVVICAPFILNTKFINVDFIVLLYILMFMLTRQKDEIYLYVRDHGWLGAMIK